MRFNIFKIKFKLKTHNGTSLWIGLFNSFSLSCHFGVMMIMMKVFFGTKKKAQNNTCYVRVQKHRNELQHQFMQHQFMRKKRHKK